MSKNTKIKDRKNQLNLLIVLAVGIAFVLGCGKTEADKKADAERQARPAKFMAALQDFSTKPTKAALVQQPYLNGKVAVLSQTTGTNSPYAYSSSFWLPNLVNTANDNPEDVKTVVFRDCRESGKSVYKTTENPPREVPATFYECDLTIVDRTIQSVIFVKKFPANLMEKISISETSKSVSIIPDREMSEFLKSLPQK